MSAFHPDICPSVTINHPIDGKWAASQASLQIKMSSRLAAGALRCTSTASLSCTGRRRMISEVLRH